MLDYKDFVGRFKLIRKEKDLHLGEHLLMKDLHTRQKVIVKTVKAVNQAQLEEAIAPIQELDFLQLQENLAHFVCCSLQNNKFLYIVYQHHEVTLEDSIKQMALHHDFFTDSQAMLLVDCVSNALLSLESRGMCHGDLRASYVLQSMRGTIDHTFKLLYTSFVIPSVKQIQQLGTDPTIYHLPPELYDQLHSADFQPKMCHDLYALGMITLNSIAKFQKHHSLAKRLKMVHQTHPRTHSVIVALIDPEPGCRIKTARQLRQKFQLSSDYQSAISNTNTLSASAQDSQFISQQHLTFKSKSEDLPTSPSDLKKKRQLLELEDKIFSDSKGGRLQQIKKKEYSDGSYYVGQLSGTIRQGRGIYYYAQGDVYAGDWRQNVLQGEGFYLFQSGEIYAGEVKMGSKSGKGTYTYQNGNVYEGQWKDDLKHGIGVYKYVSGQIYRGSFVKGNKQGEGCLTYTDGTLIQGLWKDNLLHGPVLITYANQTCWKGSFSHNIKMSGGEYSFQGGKVIEKERLEVQWNTGESFIGQMQNGLAHRFGKYSFNCTDYYEGKFKEGQFEGEGSLRFNGLKIEGSWKNHVLEKGRIVLPNGDQYIGEVRQGQFQGKGQYRFANGEVFTGIFESGRAKLGVLKIGGQQLAIA